MWNFRLSNKSQQKQNEDYDQQMFEMGHTVYLDGVKHPYHP